MIPDGLYSVQKQSDYAVYENRFLYLLLCYLRDFITVRYEKLSELSNRYDGTLTMEKSVTLGDRRLSYSVKLHDGRKDDPFLRESNPSKTALDRIELALHSVLALLATPLMEEAGKAPKLSPPITKTNVLRMDHHFRGATELYEYLCAYDKTGYSVTPLTETMAPFSDALADELAETVGLTAFLAYEYGLGLNETLKNRFLEAQSAEKKAEQSKMEQRLALLKQQMASGEVTAEEYILALEDQLRLAEGENRRLRSLGDRLHEMTEKEAQAQTQILSLGEDNRLLREQLGEAALVREREKEALRMEYEARAREAAVRHGADMTALRTDCERRIRESETAKSEALRNLTERHTAENAALEKRLLEAEDTHAKESKELRGQLLLTETALTKAETEREQLALKNLASEARIKALQIEGGAVFDDDAFTAKEDFDELERELDAFLKFYEGRWRMAKRSIRRRLLNYQSLKEQKGRK